MKKIFLLLFLLSIFSTLANSKEYPNSWKLDIQCKQGKWEWYESAFVVNVENNEFSLGPFNRWNKKDFVFKGKIENDKINITVNLLVITKQL